MNKIELPSFLENTYHFKDYRVVDIYCLYVGLLSVNSDKTKYVSIFETPHFMFANYIIHGTLVKAVHGYKDYLHYRSIHQQSHTEEGFKQLIENIMTVGYDYEKKPILVFRYWKRLLPIGRWDVADGFHRLAVLAALGKQKIRVATIVNNINILHRALKRALCC